MLNGPEKKACTFQELKNQGNYGEEGGKAAQYVIVRRKEARSCRILESMV